MEPRRRCWRRGVAADLVPNRPRAPGLKNTLRAQESKAKLLRLWKAPGRETSTVRGGQRVVDPRPLAGGAARPGLVGAGPRWHSIRWSLEGASDGVLAPFLLLQRCGRGRRGVAPAGGASSRWRHRGTPLLTRAARLLSKFLEITRDGFAWAWGVLLHKRWAEEQAARAGCEARQRRQLLSRLPGRTDPPPRAAVRLDAGASESVAQGGFSDTAGRLSAEAQRGRNREGLSRGSGRGLGGVTQLL